MRISIKPVKIGKMIEFDVNQILDQWITKGHRQLGDLKE